MLRSLYRFLILPYTVLLLYLMFFGFGRKDLGDNMVRLVPIFSTLHFIEHNLLWSNYKSLIVNILGNVVMFVPFGFLGLLFPRFQNLKPLLFSFLFVLILVETLQYFTRLGVFDVDDILLNSLGVWLGFLIYIKINQNVIQDKNPH